MEESKQDSIKGASIYFGTQAGIVALWWMAILTSDHVRSLFFVNPNDSRTILGYLVSDAVTIFCGSLLVTLFARRRFVFALSLAWLTTGATIYATLMAISTNWPIFQRPLADLGMVGISIGSLTATLKLGKP